MTEDKEFTQQYLLHLKEEIDELCKVQADLQKQQQSKPFYTRWFASADVDLQAVSAQIASLERDKDNLFKVMQNAATVPQPAPEKDLSKAPFYSHTLKSLNFNYPMGQLGFYLTSGTAIVWIFKATWRSWNTKMAQKAIENGLDSVDFHIHHSGLSSEEQVKRAMKFRRFTTGRAFVAAGLLVTTFSAFVQLKNRFT